MNKGKFCRYIYLALFVLSFSFAETQKSLMKNYCSIPPYMEADVEPNILILIDYSGSMQLPAHFECSFSSYKRVVVCNEFEWVSRTYDKNKTYYGYFKPQSYYKYNNAEGYWEENTNCNINGANERIGNGEDCVSGNLLNWISMSRYDIALKALTGGKTRNCGDGVCLIPKGAYRKVKENNINCSFVVHPNNYWRDTTEFNSADYDLKLDVNNNNGRCLIGNFSERWLRVRVDDEVIGVLQKNANLGNFAFIAFSSSNYSEYSRYGEIKFGVHEYRNYTTKEDAINKLITKINNEQPWGETPTGEAIAEVIDYLKQSNSNSYEDNSAYISKGTSVDPFYNPEFNSLSPCIKNFLLVISDGKWNGNIDPGRQAYKIHTSDLRSDLEGTQNANVFSIFIFASSEKGKNSMRTVATAGSFVDVDGDGYPYNVDINDNSLNISWPRPKCNPNGTYKENCKEWDFDEDGIPNAFFFASDGEEFEKALTEALNAMVKYNYLGDFEVVAEKQRDNNSLTLAYKGNILAQTVFFSQKEGVDWIGKIYGYWYHVNTNSIREDTNQNKILEIDEDKILELVLENEKVLKINVYNVNSTGEKTSLSNSYYDLDNVNYLFEEGKIVTENINENDNIVSNDRNVYFAKCSKGSHCMKEFTYTNLNDFIYENGNWKIPLLGIPSQCFDICPYINSPNPTASILWNSLYNCISQNNDYEEVINYIRGKDYTGFRTRVIDGKTWKLGDLMYSTPQIITYENKEKTYMFVGANDGMLHVFEIGKIEKADGDNEVIKLTGTDIGREIWAFIPHNLLPYLRFLTDPDYCHLYFVDLTPRIYQTKDNRVILIGGLRFGGATANKNQPSNSNQGNAPINPVGWSCPATFKSFFKEQCEICKGKGILDNKVQCASLVNNFPDINSCVGFSSYFAIDITDPENPEFLWEFTHPDLGFSYSRATMIFKPNGTYVLFGSGPTSYDGNSTQKLKYFIIPLDNPDLENPIIIDTTIKNAFSGRLNQYGYDANNDGFTDYIFVGYARREGTMENWKGGLLILDVRNINNVSYRKYFEDAQSPITSRVEVAKCFDSPYLFFGTGRWFYKLDNSLPGQKNRIYGVALSCDSDGNCSPNVNVAHSQSGGQNVCTDAKNGNIRSWYIELNKDDAGYLKERVITDPVITTVEGKNKIVVFTTVEPKDDPCGFGGRSRVWALNCATGGSIQEYCGQYPIEKDKVESAMLLPLSGGNIKQVNLKSVNKVSNWFTGTSPEGTPPIISGVKSEIFKGTILLWLER